MLVFSLDNQRVDKWVCASAFLQAVLMGKLLAESTVFFEVVEMAVLSDIYAVESKVLELVVLKVEMLEIE